MILANKPAAIVSFCLVDTPEDANYGTEISYEHIPEKQRYHEKKVFREVEREQQIRDRVEMCRQWLKEYDAKINGALSGNPVWMY